ncbi:hypothetical protein D3C72_1667680 [compost metagenome]
MAAVEQPLARLQPAGLGKPGKQGDLFVGKQRMHDLGHRHLGDTGCRVDVLGRTPAGHSLHPPPASPGEPRSISVNQTVRRFSFL